MTLQLLAQTTGAIAQNVEFLGADVTLNRITNALDLIIEIDITAGTTPNIEMSFDSGATWALIIPTLALNTFTRIRAAMITGDTINFRTPTVGGLTLERFNVIADNNG